MKRKPKDYYGYVSPWGTIDEKAGLHRRLQKEQSDWKEKYAKRTSLDKAVAEYRIAMSKEVELPANCIRDIFLEMKRELCRTKK